MVRLTVPDVLAAASSKACADVTLCTLKAIFRSLYMWEIPAPAPEALPREAPVLHSFEASRSCLTSWHSFLSLYAARGGHHSWYDDLEDKEIKV